MTRRITLASSAERDLIDIWSYIARDDPAAADRFITLLSAKSGLLLDFPGMGRAWRRSGDRRIFPVGNYLVLYRETRDGILILRYVHGRRDLPKVVR